MQGKIHIIHAAGNVTTTAIDSPPDLETLQAGVGGWLESVPMLQSFEGSPCAAFCNEEGKLTGLPYNAAATALWHDALRSADYPAFDCLCGDVVIVTGDAALLRSL